MEWFNAACLAAKSAHALPWETESDPPVCASHFTTDNSDGNIIDSSKCFTIACWIGLPEVVMNPLCFHSIPKSWTTPKAYLESV